MTTVRCVGRNLDRCGIRQANARIQLQMIFAARGAIAFTRVFVSQASQFVAAADTIAVARFRSGFNGHERHFEDSFAVMLHEIADLGKRPSARSARSPFSHFGAHFLLPEWGPLCSQTLAFTALNWVLTK